MKKITAIIVSLLMIISVLPIGAAENVVRSNNHLDVVKSLGIINGYNEQGADETPVTRGELASALTNILNLAYIAEENPFSDVSSDNPYYREILLMNNMGIMVGNEEGLFRPDEAVTYPQIAKCLVYILGYNVKAEGKGGYPAGYMSTASGLELFDNVTAELNGKVTRAALAEVIYQALDIPVLEVRTFGEKTSYSDIAGETVLSLYFNMKKGKGIVNAVDGRSILSRAETKEGFVQIDDIFYSYDKDAADFLGYEVEYYVSTDEDELPELFFLLSTTKNNELMIPIKDLETDNSSFSLNHFFYADNSGDTEDAEITDKHRFMFNGEYDYDFDIDDLAFDTGYVKLVDNNADNVYDAVFIWSFEDYTADTVGERQIICKYNKSLKLNDDTDYRVLSRDGIWGGWDLLMDASAWDVLSVATSKDGSLVTIHINRGGIAGNIDAVLADGKYQEVEIEGQPYTVSAQYPLMAQRNGYVELKAGLTSEFYFNVMGEIVAVYQSAANVEKYGYLLGVMELGAFKDVYSVKIFDEDGKTLVLDAEKKIKVKSALYDDKTVECKDAFKEFYTGETFNQQLVIFSVNEEGKLNSIKKAVDATALGYNISEFSKDFVINENFRYQDATKTLGDNSTYTKIFHLTGQTKIFYIPQQGGKTVEENMSITDANMFIGGNSYQDMEIYDCDDTYQAAVLLYKPADSGQPLPAEEFFFVVTDAFEGLNQEGDIAPMVRGMYRGAEREMEYVLATPSTKKPEPGSIIRFQKMLSGELVISAANTVYSPTTTTDFYRNKTEALPLVWSQYGCLFRKNGAAITVYDGGNRTPMANYLNAGYSIYKITKREGSGGKITVTKASEGDLRPSTGLILSDGSFSGEYNGTKLVINNRYQYVREMFIIDEE